MTNCSSRASIRARQRFTRYSQKYSCGNTVAYSYPRQTVSYACPQTVVSSYPTRVVTSCKPQQVSYAACPQQVSYACPQQVVTGCNEDMNVNDCDAVPENGCTTQQWSHGNTVGAPVYAPVYGNGCDNGNGNGCGNGNGNGNGCGNGVPDVVVIDPYQDCNGDGMPDCYEKTEYCSYPAIVKHRYVRSFVDTPHVEVVHKDVFHRTRVHSRPGEVNHYCLPTISEEPVDDSCICPAGTKRINPDQFHTPSVPVTRSKIYSNKGC